MFTEPEGATPITEEQKDDLIPSHIATREQLDEWEARNILEGEEWAFERKHDDVLSVAFLRELHRRMFDRTWRWAGEFRRRETNIGVPPYRIERGVVDACRDAEFWDENEVFEPPEIAARFHHSLVSVHPFPNGNGRHARLAADVLSDRLGHGRLDWGGRQALNRETDRRREYLTALQAADRRDFEPLYAFLGLS